MDNFNAELAAWIIVAGYVLAFTLVLLALRGSVKGRERLFWGLVAFGMLALGINKHLDLQTHLTAIARQMARDGDWFEARREVQASFIRWLMVVVTIGALTLAWLTRGLGAPVRLALLGVLLLAGFVVLRASSFHHVDLLLRTTLFGTRAWVVVELAGILMVIFGAGWATARRQAASRT